MPKTIRTISIDEDAWNKFKEYVDRIKKRDDKVTMSSIIEELIGYFIETADTWYFYNSNGRKQLENDLMKGN